MNQDELLTLHGELTNKAFSIFEAKNHDYTGGDAGDDPFANFRASAVMGVPAELGILVRCIDKFQRIRAFAAKGELKVKGESVEDAIIDVINYMVLLGGIVREGQGKVTGLGRDTVFSAIAEDIKTPNRGYTRERVYPEGVSAGVKYHRYSPVEPQKTYVCPHCTCFVELAKNCSCVKATASRMEKFHASVRAISCDVCVERGGVCFSPCDRYANAERKLKEENSE